MIPKPILKHRIRRRRYTGLMESKLMGNLPWIGECAFCEARLPGHDRAQVSDMLTFHVATRHTALYNHYTKQESK